MRAEVERIEGAIARIASKDAVAADRREFLRSLRATTAKREAEKLGAGTTDPAAIAGLYDLLAKRLTELGERDLARKETAAELQKELEVARAKLAAESGEIALVSEGVVRQRTGEDRSGVALRLSTAAPARGVAPPEMEPLFLSPAVSFDHAQGGYAKIVEEAPPSRRAYQNVLTMTPGVAGQEPAPAEAASREAAVVHPAYNVAFEVPGRSEVPADGADHRVVLRQETLMRIPLILNARSGEVERAFRRC